MQIIPAIDVLDGRVVRLLRGDYGDVTEYGTSPAATAVAWQSDGAELVHVVDLGGARSGDRDPGLAKVLAAAGAVFQIGGGLRRAADVQEVLAGGARRAVVGSVAVWAPELLGAMVAAAGPDRVVASIDVRRGRAVGEGWRDGGRDLDDMIAGIAGAGLRHALVTGISRDGTMVGPDLDLLARVREAAPGLELIASGGVGSLDDLRTLAAAGFPAAIVGRALYEQRFTLAEAIAAAA